MDGKIKGGGELGPPGRNLHIHSVNLGHERSRGGKGGHLSRIKCSAHARPVKCTAYSVALSWNQHNFGLSCGEVLLSQLPTTQSRFFC